MKSNLVTDLITEGKLLEIARDTVVRSQKAGADQTEVFAISSNSLEISFENNDVSMCREEQETMLGIRLFRQGRLGFACTNVLSKKGLDDSISEALALAALGVADKHNQLPEAKALPSISNLWSDTIAGLDLNDISKLGSSWLEKIKDADSKLTVDSGSLEREASTWAVANSLGVACSCRDTTVQAGIMGMAKTKNEVGSLASGFAQARELKDFSVALEKAQSDFARRALGALGARRGESFKGTAIFAAEVVEELLIDPLLYGIDASTIRKKRSRMGNSMGQPVVSTLLTIEDLPLEPSGLSASPFDREGQPSQNLVLIEEGILKHFLYNAYEASVAGQTSSGHAEGGAQSVPGIGTSLIRIHPGTTKEKDLVPKKGKAVYITGFSGSSDPISGQLSGVVKGSFLYTDGEKIPIQETMVCADLDKMFKSISAVGDKVHSVDGEFISPEIRVEDMEFSVGG